MIRINLLPVKQAKKRATGQRQALLMFASMIVVIVGIVWHYLGEQGEIEDMQKRNNEAKAAINKLKAEIGDYNEIKAKRDELIQQREAINRLNAGRTGPVYVLREFSEILTKDKGPTFSKAEYEERLQRDPNAGFNPSWDPRRVWISSWREGGRRVTLDGSAKSNDDVAEFMKRLQLSVFFSDVVLQGTRVWNSGAQGNFFSFTIFARVNY